VCLCVNCEHGLDTTNTSFGGGEVIHSSFFFFCSLSFSTPPHTA